MTSSVSLRRRVLGSGLTSPWLIAVAVGALLSAGLAVWWVARGDGSRWEQAMAALPHDSIRVTYTDWATVIAEQGKETDSDDDNALADLITRAYDADLTRTSALETSAVGLAELFKIDLREADFEAYSQATDASIAVLKMRPGVNFERIEQALRAQGFTASPDAANSYEGSAELVTRLAVGLTPIQQNFALLPEERMVAMSNSPVTTQAWLEVMAGERPNLLKGVTRFEEQGRSAVSMLMFVDDYACAELSMDTASIEDQDAAEVLIEEAGGVSPLASLAVSRRRTGLVTMGLGFEDSAQAEANLQPRVELASGPAPGLGGDFADRFSLKSAQAEGDVVTLDLAPAEPDLPLLSILTNGPILIATC